MLPDPIQDTYMYRKLYENIFAGLKLNSLLKQILKLQFIVPGLKCQKVFQLKMNTSIMFKTLMKLLDITIDNKLKLREHDDLACKLAS